MSAPLASSPRVAERQAELGEKVEFWSKGRWFTAIVTTVYPGSTNVDLCMFHPISGALPYQNIPRAIDGTKDLNRANSWRWA